MRITIQPEEATIIVQNYIAQKYGISASDVCPNLDNYGNLVYEFELPFDYGNGKK